MNGTESVIVELRACCACRYFYHEILAVFAEYLKEDTDVEIVKTQHGWTYMVWDNCQCDWSRLDYAETLKDLRDFILYGLHDYLEMQITGCERELTEDERREIDTICEKYKRECGD